MEVLWHRLWNPTGGMENRSTTDILLICHFDDGGGEQVYKLMSIAYNSQHVPCRWGHSHSGRDQSDHYHQQQKSVNKGDIGSY